MDSAPGCIELPLDSARTHSRTRSNLLMANTPRRPMRAKRVPYPSEAHSASAASISNVRYCCATPLNTALNAHPVFRRVADHSAPSAERVPAIFVPRAYQPRLRHLNYLVAYVRSMSGQLPSDVAPSRADEMPVGKAEQARQKEHPADESEQPIQHAPVNSGVAR